ncbi:MAG TPA: hypothetical protein VH165_37610 [Kofleriaceae bacterium]|jgi:hypothetical protein|nr:hypothetical protein [Kofleriaceae bacterium]
MATTRPGRIVALAIAAAGCQGGKSEPPAGTAGSAASPVAVATHVQLPRSPDAPLSYATRPIDRDALARLAAIEFPDFERQGSHATESTARVRHVTRTRPILGVTVELTRCAKPCPAISTARWVARRDEVIELALPATLVRRPDTRFELGGVTVAGVPALYSYALGSTGASDTTAAQGQPSETYVDSYTLDYRDGVTQFHVAASYLDDAVGGVDRLLAIAPPEDLQKLATAFLSFYLHECQ